MGILLGAIAEFIGAIADGIVSILHGLKKKDATDKRIKFEGRPVLWLSSGGFGLALMAGLFYVIFRVVSRIFGG